jgi:hypothetical protein
LEIADAFDGGPRAIDTMSFTLISRSRDDEQEYIDHGEGERWQAPRKAVKKDQRSSGGDRADNDLAPRS